MSVVFRNEGVQTRSLVFHSFCDDKNEYDVEAMKDLYDCSRI